MSRFHSKENVQLEFIGKDEASDIVGVPNFICEEDNWWYDYVVNKDERDSLDIQSLLSYYLLKQSQRV